MTMSAHAHGRTWLKERLRVAEWVVSVGILALPLLLVLDNGRLGSKSPTTVVAPATDICLKLRLKLRLRLRLRLRVRARVRVRVRLGAVLCWCTTAVFYRQCACLNCHARVASMDAQLQFQLQGPLYSVCRLCR